MKYTVTPTQRIVSSLTAAVLLLARGVGVVGLRRRPRLVLAGHGWIGAQRESCSSRSCQAWVVPIALTSGWFIQRKSNTGRSERIGGSQSKLCTGGGDVVAHSNELACHGSAPSVVGRRNDRTRLITNGTNDSDEHDHAERRDEVAAPTSSTSG